MTQPLTIRLERPGNPSTCLSEHLVILGWFTGPGAEQCVPEDISILISPENRIKDSLAEVSQLRAQRVTAEPEVPGARLIRHAVLSVEECRERYPEFHPPADVRCFEAHIDVSELLSEGSDVHADIVLLISRESTVSISNSVSVCIAHGGRRHEALGGFLFPQNLAITSDTLGIRGWAMRQGDAVSDVQIHVGGAVTCAAVLQSWSPEIAVALPGLEEAKRAAFTLMLDWETCEEAVLASQRKQAGLALRADVTFESGAKLRLDGPTVFWRPKPEASSLYANAAAVESIEEQTCGRVRVQGCFVSSMPSLPQIRLESAVRSFEIPADEIAFECRPDIESRFFPAAFLTSGFSFTFNPFALGRVPGPLYCRVSWTNGDAVRFRLRELEKFIHERSEWQGNVGAVTRMLRAGVMRVLALHRQLPRIRFKPRAVERQGSHFVFSHNLSSTEGAPAVLADVLEARRRYHPKESVYVGSPFDGALGERLRASGAVLELLPHASVVGQTPERYEQAVRQLFERFLNLGIQAVSANTIDAFVAVDAALRAGIPVTWTIHECMKPLESFPDLHPTLRMRYLDTLRACRRFIFVSEASRSVFKPYISLAESSVIHNGVALDVIDAHREEISVAKARRVIGIPEDAFVVTIVGTTTHRKGQDVFVREMSEVAKRVPEARFYIVGARPGAFYETLRKLIIREGLERNCFLIDETPDVAPFYIASDVMVVASREESSPLVTLEAFAYGVPLVSTEAFGLREQLTPEVTALVFDAEVQGMLASQVLRLHADAGLRTKLVRGAREAVERRFKREEALRSHLFFTNQAAA